MPRELKLSMSFQSYIDAHPYLIFSLSFSVMKEEDQDDVLLSIVDTSEKYRCLLEKDSEMASKEDFLHALNLYGNPHQMDSLLASESNISQNMLTAFTLTKFYIDICLN